MPLTLSADLDKARCREIVLAGQTYYVAPLPLRQVLALADILPKLRNITIDNINGELFDPIIDVVTRGLLKAYPGVTTDDLLDLPISISELMDAVPVVIGQAGGKKAEGDTVVGEAKAADPSKAPTGVDSSPT